MALSRSKKETIVKEVSELFDSSQLTVLASYHAVDVQQMQALRRLARDSQVTVRVIKNRLVSRVLAAKPAFKAAAEQPLAGTLVYVFSPADETAGVQVLQQFIKDSQAEIDFQGAITGEGSYMSQAEVQTLAKLGSKTELIGQTHHILRTPINQLQAGLSGGLANLMSALKAQAN